MAEPFIGEVRMFAGSFAPVGWALCDGAIVQIADNDVLYSLIGTTYGGDGMTTFALPDLRGRAPLHKSGTYQFGARGGAETVTLAATQLPVHTHQAMASTVAGTAISPENAVWAVSPYTEYATGQSPDVAMSPQAVSPVGGSTPHENMMPFLVINYIIATAGYYPSQG